MSKSNGNGLFPAEARYVLWLDPGVTTGWALYYVDQQRLITDEYDFPELCWRIERWCASSGPATVVGVERFVITPGKARFHEAYDALYTIGAAKSAASRHRALRFLDGQTSSVGKSFGSDEVLKACGWYSYTKTHGNDAARHMGTYLSSQGVAPRAWTDSIRGLLEKQET